MSTKSKNKEKKLLLIGTAGLMTIGSLGVGLSFTTEVNAMPEGIGTQDDYFTADRNKSIQNIINKIGLNNNSFLEEHRNEAMLEIATWKQFGIFDSNVTIDNLIYRAKKIERFGLYGFVDGLLEKISLKKDIEHLEEIKVKADKLVSDPNEINKKYREYAEQIKKQIEEVVSVTVKDDTAEGKLTRDLRLTFSAINGLWNTNQDFFREYAFDYIKSWIEKTENKKLVNNKKLSITLAKQDDVFKQNIVFVAGSAFNKTSQTDWNNNIGLQFGMADYTDMTLSHFLKGGTNILETTKDGAKAKNIMFVKNKLSPADLMLFHLLASGQFNSDEELSKLSKNPTVEETVNTVTTVGKGDKAINLNIGKYLRNRNVVEENQEILGAFNKEFFNINTFLALQGRSFSELGSSASAPKINYDQTLRGNNTDPNFYMAKARNTERSVKANILVPLEQEARKYFIERFYVGQDKDNLKIDRVTNDSATIARLNKTPKVTDSIYHSYTYPAYDIIKNMPIISNYNKGEDRYGKYPSLSIIWFIANHYKKNGKNFDVTYPENYPEWAKSKYWQYNTAYEESKINSVSGIEGFKKATDKIIYDYIESIITNNKFDIEKPEIKEMFRALFRFIRSAVTHEQNLTIATNGDIEKNSFDLNGYNQDSSKPAFSEILTLGTSLVIQHYDEFLKSVEKALIETSVNYGKNPSLKISKNFEKLTEFFQLYLNPLQFNMDDTRRSAIDVPEWLVLTKYMSENYPFFGKVILKNTHLQSLHTLNGRSVKFSTRLTPEFLHETLLKEWKKENSISETTTMTPELFEKFRNWFFYHKLPWAIKILVINGSKATDSTDDLDKIDVFGESYTSEPYNYPLSHIYNSIQVTNNAVLDSIHGKIDEIPASESDSLGLNVPANIRLLGFPSTFNAQKDLNNVVFRKIFTKKYFDVKTYDNYVTQYKLRKIAETNLAPLPPDFSSSIYSNDYNEYSRDYSIYLSLFNKNSKIDPNLRKPQAPAKYKNVSLSNSTHYFENYNKYFKLISEYNEVNKTRRNKALRMVSNIQLATEQDTNYRVTLKDGTVITNKDSWYNEDKSPKVKNNAQVVKIELGDRHIDSLIVNSFVIWNDPNDYSKGIKKINPGTNGYTTNPENLLEKITTRNLLINRLADKSLADYKVAYEEISNWYNFVKNDIAAAQIPDFDLEILSLVANERDLQKIDGYTIDVINNIDKDPRYPWDNAGPKSYDLKKDSLFKSLMEFVEKVKIARMKNSVTLRKTRDLTLEFIETTLSGDAEHRAARHNLDEFLDGRKILDADGNLVSPAGSTIITPLSTSFPNIHKASVEAINAVEFLRNYTKGGQEYSFDGYSRVLNNVTDNDYLEAISTQSLIFEHKKFNKNVFDYDTSKIGDETITKSSWDYRKITLTPEQLKNLDLYNKAVDKQTGANTAFRFFNKLISPADPNTDAYVDERNMAINAINELYLTIGTPGTVGSVSYNPKTNVDQAAIDAKNRDLTGDISNISPSKRATLAKKYYDAENELSRVRQELVNVTALKHTREALEYIYVNSRLTVGQYNRETLINKKEITPFFGYSVTAGKREVKNTLNIDNKAVILVNKALESIKVLDDFASLHKYQKDYYAALYAISELVKLEQELVSTTNLTFDKEKFVEIDSKIVKIFQDLESGTNGVPKYQDTDLKTIKKFEPLLNTTLKNIVVQKGQYLTYLAASQYIKDNFIPSFDIENLKLDPSLTNHAAWNNYVTKLKQQGSSSVVYRSLSDDKKKILDEAFSKILPVIMHSNRGNDVAPKTREEIGKNIPYLSDVNLLKRALNFLEKNKNSISKLDVVYKAEEANRAKYEASLKEGNVAAKTLLAVIDQSKNFINIHNSVNNNNANFGGVASVGNAKDKKTSTEFSLNEFTQPQIDDQLHKLNNIKEINAAVVEIKKFRDQYTKIGIGGEVGKKPTDLKSHVTSEIYSAWEEYEAKAKKLFEEGLIPNTKITFGQLTSSVNKKVSLAPALDSKGNLVKVDFSGNELISEHETIIENLKTFLNDLILKTNALTNTVSVDQLIPLLNELNGNYDSDKLVPVAKTNNPNNIVYTVNLPDLKKLDLNAPSEKLNTASPDESSFKNFEELYKIKSAFEKTREKNINHLSYKDFLKVETKPGVTPIRLWKNVDTNQSDINKAVKYINDRMTEHVMNGVYWASSDFILLSKVAEFVLEEKNSTSKKSDGQFIPTKVNTFDKAFNKAKKFFEAEFKKENPEFVKVEAYDDAADLGGKTPIFNFDQKMKSFSNEWKTILIKLLNGDQEAAKEFHILGASIKSLATLGNAKSTISRATYISTYRNYLDARKKLDGKAVETSSKDPNVNTLQSRFDFITTQLGADWETKAFVRTIDIELQDWLKHAKILLSESKSNKIVIKSVHDNVLSRLNLAYQSKVDADKSTKVEIVNKLPQIANRINSILRDNTTSNEDKISLLKEQETIFATAIGVSKDLATGYVNKEGKYVLPMFTKDLGIHSSILQTFEGKDENLLKVANTYAKTLQSIDMIIFYLEAIVKSKNEPLKSNTDVFNTLNDGVQKAFLNDDSGQIFSAKKDIPTLLITSEENGIRTSSTSTIDINSLNDLVSGIELFKGQITKTSSDITSVSQALFEAKSALDNWVDDKDVDFDGEKFFSTRDPLITVAKAKMDALFKANESGVIAKEVFNTYMGQLSKYYKALLTLEKNRNLFYVVLSDEESANVSDNPNDSFEKSDLDLLYSQYVSFKNKYTNLSTSANGIKSLYHVLKDKMLDSANRAKVLKTASHWLLNLKNSIETINSFGNPNKIENNSIIKLRNMGQKATGGFQLFKNYYDYLDSNFSGNPILSEKKDTGVEFELDNTLRNYQKGEHKLDTSTFVILSDSIKKFVAFNGLVKLDGSTNPEKIGALANLLKNPTNENFKNIKQLVASVESTLEKINNAISNIPEELRRHESLTSWTFFRIFNDIKDETVLNIAKLKVFEKLISYLHTTTDEAKTEFNDALNTFITNENKEHLSGILNTKVDSNATLFEAHYLEALKELTKKVSKIGDNFNNIDKLEIGKVDPSNPKVMISSSNISQIQETYLNAIVGMVDDVEDETEITSLTKEIPNDNIRNYVLSEINISNIKKETILKVNRKRFELLIQKLHYQELENYDENNSEATENKKQIASASQPSTLKVMANFEIAQKNLESAYNDYVTGKKDITIEKLIELETVFFNLQKTFEGLKSDLTNWPPSEQKLYSIIDTEGKIIGEESRAITSLHKYLDVPNNDNKNIVKDRFEKLSSQTKQKDIFRTYFAETMAKGDDVNRYWNNEIDLTSSKSSIENTYQKALDLEKSILPKLTVPSGEKVSPLYLTLNKTIKVIKASVIVEKQLMDLLDFNSLAKKGEVSFDTLTNAIKNKSHIFTKILENDLKDVDSNSELLNGIHQRTSVALRDLLEIINVIQTANDLISSGKLGFNYIGDPQNKLLGQFAYSGQNGTKIVFDKFVKDNTTWENRINDNSFARLKGLSTRVLEQIKAMNQLSKVVYLFSSANNNVLGTNPEIVGDNSTFYNAFVKEYDVLKANYEKYKLNRSSEGVEIVGLYNSNTDFWRSFDQVISFIDLMHKNDGSGAIDLLNKFLESEDKNATDARIATSSINKVFSFSIPNKIENRSFAVAGRMMLEQLSQINIFVKITTDLRTYYESQMEKGFRGFLGEYSGETHDRIEGRISEFNHEYGSSDGLSVGTIWDTKVSIALQNNSAKISSLKSVIRSIQKLIEVILKTQTLVDKYVKEPTEENRLAVVNSPLWGEFDNAFNEVDAIAKLKPSDTVSESVIQFASELSKLRNIQKNKIRFVQGLLVAALSKDIRKVDFEAIANPYEDSKALLGNTFNLYSSLGASKLSDGGFKLEAIEGSLLFGATRYKLSSDTLIYQILNQINPKEGNITLDYASGEEIKQFDLETNFAGKNSSYFSAFMKIQNALKTYDNPALFNAEKSAELIEFAKRVELLVNEVKTLNEDAENVDTNSIALYNNVKITLPGFEAKDSVNFEGILFNIIDLLSKQIQYDTTASNLINTLDALEHEKLLVHRSNIISTREKTNETRSKETIAAHNVIHNQILGTLNKWISALEEYKNVSSNTNLELLEKVTTELEKEISGFSTIRKSTHPSKVWFMEQMVKKLVSIKNQLALLKVSNKYFENINEENKKDLEASIKNLKDSIVKPRAESVSGLKTSKDEELLALVEKVKFVADKALLAKDAYYATSGYNWATINTIVGESKKAHDFIKDQNTKDKLINSFLSRVNVLITNLQSLSDNDKKLTDYVANSTDMTKSQLNSSIEKTKNDIYEAVKNESLLYGSSSEDSLKYAELAKEGIPSLVSMEYVKAAEELQKLMKLYDQYKSTYDPALRAPIQQGIEKVNVLNELIKYFSLEVSKISNPKVNTTTNYEKLLNDYNTKYPADSAFGQKELERLNKILEDIKSKKQTLETALKTAEKNINDTSKNPASSLEQIGAADKFYLDSLHNLRRFNILITPFSINQNSINDLIKLRADGIDLQVPHIDALKEYVAAKKEYALRVYAVGNELVKNRDEIARFGKIIEDSNHKIDAYNKEISDLEKVSNPSIMQLKKLRELKENIRDLEKLINASRASADELKTEQSGLITRLDAELQKDINVKLKNAVITSAEAVLGESIKIDKELLKNSTISKSKETLLALHSLAAVEMLGDLKNILGNYFKNPYDFVSKDISKVNNYVFYYEQMENETERIIPTGIFDDIKASVLKLINDAEAYEANTNYILDPSQSNKQKAVSENSIAHTIPDVVTAINGVAEFNSLINSFKENYIDGKADLVAKNAYVGLKILTDKVLATSFVHDAHLSSLQVLRRESSMQKSLEIIKAQFDVLKTTSDYLKSPTKENFEAIETAKSEAKSAQVLNANQQKIRLLVELVKQLNNTVKSTEEIVNNTKTGLADQVDKLIDRSKDNPNDVTLDEISNLKNKVLTGDKNPPLSSIKDRLARLIEKLEQDKRLFTAIKNLVEVGKFDSSLNSKFVKNPGDYLKEDSNNLKVDLSKKIALIDKLIEPIGAETLKNIKDAEKLISDIEAKDINSRSQQEKDNLVNAKKLVDLVKDLQLKQGKDAETLKLAKDNLANALKELDVLNKKKEALLDDKEKSNLRAARRKDAELTTNINGLVDQKTKLEKELKSLEDKAKLALSEEEKTKLAEIKNVELPKLKGKLNEVENQIKDLKGKASSMISEVSKAALSAEETNQIENKRKLLATIEDKKVELISTITKNNDDLEKDRLDKARTILDLREFQDYLSNKKDLKDSEKELDNLNSQLALLIGEIRKFETINPALMSNQDKELMAKKIKDKDKLSEVILKAQNKIDETKRFVTNAENKVTNNLSEPDKSKVNQLVDKNKELEGLLDEANKNSLVVTDSINLLEKKVYNLFNDVQKAEFDNINAQIVPLEISKKATQDEIDVNSDLVNNLETKDQYALKADEKGKVNTLKTELKDLEVKLSGFEKDLSVNNKIVEMINNKTENSLSEEEKAKLNDLTSQVANLETSIANSELEASGVSFDIIERVAKFNKENSVGSIEKQNSLITLKNSEINDSLSDVSVAGKQKTADLRAELVKLKDDLAKLKDNDFKNKVLLDDVVSLSKERNRLGEWTKSQVERNAEMIKNHEESGLKGLLDLVAKHTNEVAKDATKTNLAAGVLEEDANINERLVATIEANNNLELAKKNFNDVTDADNHNKLVAAIDKLNNNRDLLRNINTDKYQEAIKAIHNEQLSKYNLEKFENDFIVFAKKVFEDTNEKSISDYKESILETNTALNNAKQIALQDGFDANDEIGVLTNKIIAETSKVSDVINQFNQYGKTLEDLKNAKNNLKGAPKTTKADIDAIEKDINSFALDDANPVLKLHRDLLKKQLVKLSEDLELNDLDNNLNDSRKKLSDDTSADNFKDFADKLDKANNGNSKNAKGYDDAKDAINTLLGAIKSYEDSDVDVPESIATGTKAINDARNKAIDVINNPNASKDSKDLANDILKTADGLLDKLKNSDDKKDDVSKELDKAIKSYTINPSGENLDKVKKSIDKAKDSRVNTKGIEEILDLKDKIDDLNKASDDFKDDIFNDDKKKDLLDKLDKAIKKFDETKDLSKDNPTLKDLNDLLGSKLDNIKDNADILTGTADGRSINKDLDKAIDNIDAPIGKTTQDDLKDIEKAIDNLPTNNDLEKKTKSTLGDKLDKTKNEIKAKDLIDKLPVDPSEDDIKHLSDLVDKSLGNYKGVVKVIKLKNASKHEIDKFRNSDHNDENVSKLIDSLHESTNDSVSNATELSRSTNPTVSTFGRKLLDKEETTKLFVDAEISLFEGIKQKNIDKIKSSHDMYEKLNKKGKKMVNNDQYEKFFTLLDKWSTLVEKANKGSVKSIKEIKELAKSLDDLKSVSNVSVSGLKYNVDAYDTVTSGKYKFYILSLMASIVLLVSSAILFLFRKKRKDEEENKK